MKLSHASAYALHALAHLAERKDGQPVASHEIARAREVPERYLLKLFRPLVSARVLHSLKGPNGGYRLARPAAQVTLLEVVEAVDGPVRGESPLAGVSGRHAGLDRALQAGYDALRRGTSADGVEAAIRVLEDSPRFNAGKGAVFTHDGRNELDAALMEGKDRRAGAVAGVTRVKNPITAARAVLEKSEHVLLVGPGADRFAREQGLEMVDPSYFWTPQRWKELEDARRQEKGREGKGPRGHAPGAGRHLGTVGAVALDRQGTLTAGTSTGGLTNKRYGRVGDSPLIGAGTYAENGACAHDGSHHTMFRLLHRHSPRRGWRRWRRAISNISAV